MSICFEELLYSLPDRVSAEIRSLLNRYERVEEIHLYVGCPAVIISEGEHIVTTESLSMPDMKKTVLSLCGGSLYAHESTLSDGYITTGGGLRVGVCGRAVCGTSDRIHVSEITSLCIRVPQRHPGAANTLLPLFTDKKTLPSLLLFSSPGVGKTTVLRELAIALAERQTGRIAVIDTRGELSFGTKDLPLHLLRGYSRASGMDLAVRVLNPQLIMCDELANEEDAEAVRRASASGVAVVATAHAETRADLTRHRALAPLVEDSIFDGLVSIARTGTTLTFIFHVGGDKAC